MTTDATQVTGSALSGGPRPGDVLAERYELLEALDHEGPSIGYRAIDQETERPVLVRVLTSPGLHTRTCDEVVERLRGLIGVGGRFLSSLLDADREGRAPFTVESFPTGTQLSAILDARRGRGEGLGPRELLPVIARLAAGLAAVPPRWHHGDVRAERVWLDTDGLRLTGPYLLVALPSDELAERIDGLGPGVVAYPPETREGRTGPSADRWGVAAIAWEALTGRAPDPATRPDELTPAVHAALAALLDPDPARRPPDLGALLDAIAEVAALPVPRLDPERHQPPAAAIGSPPSPKGRRIAGAAPEGTQEISFDQIMEERPLGRRVAGAAPEGTQEISFDQIMEERPLVASDDTAKHRALALEPDSLDPRLVRAALGVRMDSGSDELEASRDDAGPDSIDPRLVRAALDVRADSEESGVDELPSDELEVLEADEAPPVASRPPSAKPTSSKPRLGGMPAPRPFPAPRPAPDAPSDAASPRPARDALERPAAPSDGRHAPARSSAGPTPGVGGPSAAHAPQPTSPSGGGAPEPPSRQITSPAPPPPAARSASVTSSASESAPAATTPATPRRAVSDASPRGSTSAVSRDGRERAAASRSRAGLWIVVGALVLAMMIVGLGFFIAAQRRSDAARSRQIQERLQQLRPPEADR